MDTDSRGDHTSERPGQRRRAGSARGAGEHDFRPGRVASSVVWALAMTCGAVRPGAVRGAAIPVPNASFESPVTPFVSVAVDGWQKSPKPDWYDETGGAFWYQLTGIFKNPVAGSMDHIENCDGAQAGWLFAVPEVAMFQDSDTTPPPVLDVRFDAGKSYRLTVGVIGMGGNMLEGVPLELSLYYRDAGGNPVTVAATTVTNSAAVFPARTRFVDFAVQVPEVRPGDAWAGKHIGIGFRSAVTFEMQGGFWDLDHVRLEAFGRPVFEAPAWSDGQFEATIVSEPGTVLEMLASTSLAGPVGQWLRVTTLTNETGRVQFTDPGAGDAARFYQAQVIP